LAKLVPDYFFIAQGLNITEQLCGGCRWFDMRFSWVDSQWKLYHGQASINAYGLDLQTVMTETASFLKAFPREVVFWRIKIDSAYANNLKSFTSTLRSSLSTFMINPVSDRSLYNLTLESIYAQAKPGNLIVLSHDWEAPDDPSGQGYIWNSESNLKGYYADANTMGGMLTKCSVGEQVALIDYKSTYANETVARPMFGLWWTFTGGNIRTNTASLWSQYPNGLNDFFVRNGGEIGNVIIVDFFGDNDAVMEIVIAYNTNKYGGTKPLLPTNGFSMMNDPELPGSQLLQEGACDNSNSDNATAAQKTLLIGVGVGILLGLVLIIVLIIIIICCVCRKRKTETKYTLLDVTED